MSDRYQVECLLRPPVELFSAGLAFSMAALVTGFWQWFYMPPTIAGAGAVFFSGYGLWRLRQGMKIVHYRWRLKRLPRFSLRRDRIPVSGRQLYVGRGFRWEGRHTQRLRDCLLPHNARYFTAPKRSEAGKRLALACERFGLPGVGSLVQSDSPFNPLRPLPPVGGRPEIHGVGLWEGEKAMYSPINERVGHTLVLGTTRVGKTRFAEILVTQDIRRGDTTIVIDPKGDADLLQAMYAACQQAGRLDRFTVFHLAYPEHSARYNPVGSYSRITQVATRIANSLPGSGNSAAFKEFGWRFVNIVAQARHILGQRPTYQLIQSHISNSDSLLIRYGQHWMDEHGIAGWVEKVDRMKYGLTGAAGDENKPRVPPLTTAERSHDIHAVCIARTLLEVMQEEGTTDPVAEGLLSAFKYERSYFDKITASLGPFLEKLSTGAVAALFSPDYDSPDPRRSFDWLGVIQGGGAVSDSNSQVLKGYAWIDRLAVPRDRHAARMELVIAHELLHAYGIDAHADPDMYPSSLLGPVLPEDPGVVPPLFVSLEGEVLLAMHGIAPGTPVQSLDPDSLELWEEDAFQLAGSMDAGGGMPAIEFGATLRNGLVRPWAVGPRPDTWIRDNPDLADRDTATWSGSLLGITRLGETASGNAAIMVDLGDWRGQARFGEIETWGTHAHPGTRGSGQTWQDGDLDYTIMVPGDGASEGFVSIPSGTADPGTVTGVFTGERHDGATGILEHPELSGAFGTRREP